MSDRSKPRCHSCGAPPTWVQLVEGERDTFRCTACGERFKDNGDEAVALELMGDAEQSGEVLEFDRDGNVIRDTRRLRPRGAKRVLRLDGDEGVAIAEQDELEDEDAFEIDLQGNIVRDTRFKPPKDRDG